MKKSRFSDEQIVTAIKEHEAGTPTQELCRRLGIGQQTLYRWKAKYGGMSVPDAQRLKSLEDENRRLKKLVANQALDIDALTRLLLVARRAGRRHHRRCPRTGVVRKVRRDQKRPLQPLRSCDFHAGLA